MMSNKPHLEFFEIDEDGWHTPEGYPKGFQQKILVSNLDEVGKTGSRTRLMRLAAGTHTTKPFVHDHWEEVFLFDGDLIVGNDEAGQGGEQFHAPTYAIRPPGTLHGPFKSETGCTMFEIHYYQADD